MPSVPLGFVLSCCSCVLLLWLCASVTAFTIDDVTLCNRPGAVPRLCHDDQPVIVWTESAESVDAARWATAST